MVDVAYKPPFGAEGTEYSPTPIKPTWEQICLIYGRRITQAGSETAGTTGNLMYTVPVGKIFLLLTANLSIVNQDGNPQTCYLMILPPLSAPIGASYNILRIAAAPSDGEVTCAISPCIPLKCVQGERIVVYNVDPAAETHGCITGYEIDVSLFNQII